MVDTFHDLTRPLTRPRTPSARRAEPSRTPPFRPSRRPPTGRPVGKAARLLATWGAVITATGLTLSGLVFVGARTLDRMAGHAVDAGQAKPITLAPLAKRSVVYASDGSVLTTLHAEEDRVQFKLADVPSHVIRAVLDAEDDRFYEHGAIDARAIMRAFVSNVEAGGVSEGGSTITQQLVKLELLTSQRDVNRKLKEAVLAVRMQEQFTKDQILERYLNAVYFGNGAYGLEAAAQLYYGIDVGQLNLPQGVLLAGLIRYPGGADPFANPQAAKDRRDAVADRMKNLGHITEAEANQVKADPLPTAPPPREAQPSDYFAEHVKQELLNAPWLGDTVQERYQRIFKGGMHIHTTLDSHAQELAQQAVTKILPDDPRGFTAALVSVEPGTGAVRALVGGPNFDQDKFNLVTDGDGRQVGSAFKMITLMAAVESGVQPADLIDGSYPCPIANPGSTDDPWTPTNVEGEGGGMMTVTSATINSVNCAYARLIKLVGPQKVVDVAHRLGITNNIGPYLSITLGSEPVTPLQMATAYATIANDGVRNDPFFIDWVDTPDGGMLWKHNPTPTRAVTAQNARTVNSILTQVVSFGTGAAAALPGRPVGGKTGSADSNADAWFLGYTPQMATAVWMGAPEGRVPMYNVGAFPRVYGGTYPAMIWRAYMAPLLSTMPVVPFPEPAPSDRRSQYLEVPGAPTNPSRGSNSSSNSNAANAGPVVTNCRRGICGR